MGPDTGYELRTFDIIARVGGAAYPDDVAVQSYFFVTGVSSSSWLSYVSTCLEAQQAAEKAVTLAENSATTAKKAAASASADAKTAQDNASSAQEAADKITFIANGCKGYYSTAQDLRDAYPTAAAGSWAIVAENSTIWVWNPATSAWKDSSVNVDFSDYYKKSEADAKFGTPYSLPPGDGGPSGRRQGGRLSGRGRGRHPERQDPQRQDRCRRGGKVGGPAGVEHYGDCRCLEPQYDSVLRHPDSRWRGLCAYQI